MTLEITFDLKMMLKQKCYFRNTTNATKHRPVRRRHNLCAIRLRLIPENVPVLFCFSIIIFIIIINSFQPVLHDWGNKGRGMCYPSCGMMHVKEPLLPTGKSSLCGGSGFPLSLYEWSFTICLTPYNRK